MIYEFNGKLTDTKFICIRSIKKKKNSIFIK